MIFSKSLFLLFLGTLVLMGCESEESDKIHQAQACLDAVPDDQYTTASKCANHLNGINTKQAWILRCSIDFLSGGLTTTRIMNAYKELDGQRGEDKEAYFMATLSLASTSAADSAFETCEKSGVNSLKYIASLSRAGTHLSAAVPGLLDAISSAGSDYQVDEIEMDTALTNCKNKDPSCDKAAIGESVKGLTDSYCAGDNADAEVCGDIEKAVKASDGSSSSIGDLMICLLDKPLQPPCDTL
jgi:hypothetical protein